MELAPSQQIIFTAAQEVYRTSIDIDVDVREEVYAILRCLQATSSKHMHLVKGIEHNKNAAFTANC